MKNYKIRFHNVSGCLILQGSCQAELRYKIRKFVPELYIRSIELFEDYELYIKTQKQ